MYLILNRTEKSRKKPVETEEIWLTKRLERMKVNCGTVLRTRMNIDDFALQKQDAVLRNIYAGKVSGPENLFRT
jgi:hypothetical protein